MPAKRNGGVNVNVKSDLLYNLTSSPTPGYDPGATLAQLKV